MISKMVSVLSERSERTSSWTFNDLAKIPGAHDLQPDHD